MSRSRRSATPRYRTRVMVVAGVLALWIQPGCTGEAGDDEPLETPPFRQADHHLHLSSERAASHLDRISLLIGERSEDDPPSEPKGAEDVLAAMDEARVQKGLVFSNAYMLGMPEAELEDEAEAVRAENAFIAEQVAAHPERLIGLCSVNPLADYAMAEVERCANDARIGGLKLHFANSGVDLRDPSHRATVGALFAYADDLGLPLAVHLRTREPEYGDVDVRLFIESVMAQADTVPIQIAHMAGWGGYDEATDAALGAFIDAIEGGRIDGDRVTFGLGAVVFDPDVAVAGGDTARARTVTDANGKLAERIRALGAARVVYGTDWPSWPPVEDPVTGIARNLELVRRALPLSEAEMDSVIANVSPIFEWTGRAGR